jgi:hypothetical protein
LINCNWKTKYYKNGEYVAHTNPSIWSFGEIITIKENEEYLGVKSECIQKWTLFDYGVNKKNVEIFVEKFTSWLPRINEIYSNYMKIQNSKSDDQNISVIKKEERDNSYEKEENKNIINITPIQTSSKYMENKKNNIYSTFRGQKILGGLLPKKISLGFLTIYYDEDYPKNNGSIGHKTKIVSNGNMQVFYKEAKDLEKYLFIGKSVDYYEE